LHGFQLVFTPTLESAGVMENIALMTREHKFVFDVMLATLHMPGPDIRISIEDKMSLTNLYRRVELNLARR
jgi:hypothetical protein